MGEGACDPPITCFRSWHAGLYVHATVLLLGQVAEKSVGARYVYAVGFVRGHLGRMPGLDRFRRGIARMVIGS